MTGGLLAQVPIGDATYWFFLLPGLLLGFYAQIRLSSAYNRYIRMGLATGASGAEAAREILDRAGLQNMAVNAIPGHLTDHYDPIKKALFLSEENFHGRSIAAVGVAAHEAGHALQHQAAYAPLQLRMAMVPLTSFATRASFFLFFGGLLLGFTKLALLAVVIYGVIAAFQLVTLPVEYDASRRAKEKLLSLGIVQQNEAGAVSSVLNAAALTYVAAMVSSLLTFLYWLSILRGSNRG
jgi:Zn-dependent membrane protease YugP